MNNQIIIEEIESRKDYASAADSLKREFGVSQFIGQCKAIQELRRKIEKISSCDIDVLISGESGTGKELVARAIHYLSRRAGKPFIPVNCGAIPESLFENELFGHVKGAFTDACLHQIGLVKEAEQGTLFAAKVKSNHRIFKSIKVVDGGESWDYDYVASPGNRKKGEQKKSGRDGSKKKPYLITWFKRPLRKYNTILLAKTRVGKRMSRANLMKLKAKGKATEYKPTQRKASPGGEDTIGVTRDNQVKKGMILGPPTSGRSDTEKDRFNRLIEAYGYDRSEEPTDGDHVVELQVSGKDDFRNLWPLNSSENRRSGSKLSRYEVKTKDGKNEKIKKLTGKFFEIKDFDY